GAGEADDEHGVGATVLNSAPAARRPADVDVGGVGQAAARGGDRGVDAGLTLPHDGLVDHNARYGDRRRWAAAVRRAAARTARRAAVRRAAARAARRAAVSAAA